MGHARQVSYERLWERLMDFLNGWSTATEIEPGRLRVAVDNADGSTRVVEVLMTREQWDDMVATAWGDYPSAAQEVRKAVIGLPRHQRFLIYGDYELVPSATPNLPADPEGARLDERAREHPEGVGRWVVTDRDGHVRDEFSPPPD